MAANKFNNLWEMMSEHSFSIVGSVSDELVCNLCGKLMIEPYSTECGCLFCKRCIENYLNNTRKPCPGKRLGCKEEILEMEMKVCRDLRTRHKIATCVVKCPNVMCSYTESLDKINEHVRICRMRPAPCPYQNIGCADDSVMGDNMEQHLQSEAILHSQLMVEAVTHLRNDVDELLRCGVTRNDDGNDEQKREIELLKEERGVNMNEIVVLKREVATLRQREDQKEIRTKNELERLNREINTLKKEAGDKKEINDIKRLLEKQSAEMTDMRNKSVKCIAEVEKVSTTSAESMLRAVYDCVWKISDLTKKKGEHFSPDFSVNSYKFCLRAWMGTDNLWLFLCVKRGELDGVVEWPMRLAATLSVINQQTMRPHLTEQYCVDTHDGDRSVFNRPANDSDCRIGNLQVSLTTVRAVRGLVACDSLLVCCSLLPPSR